MSICGDSMNVAVRSDRGYEESTDPMNPYAPPTGRSVDTPRLNRFVIGVQRSIFALIATLIACGLLVIVAKGIDSAIPGEGSLNDATIFGILWNAAFIFALIVMISFFSTFAYYAGEKQLNAGVCVIVVFSSGILSAGVLSAIGYQSPRRLRMEHPPLYLSEFLTYFIPYAVSAMVLTFIASSRMLPSARPNNPMDRSGGSPVS